MSGILLLRHAPTAWNAEGRMQGRADIALSPEGRALAARWRLPAFAAGWPVHASPLIRALDTARAMSLSPVPVPAFAEMDWGAFEGRRLDDLRREKGEAFLRNEARGLDFRPEDGESPREAGARALAGLRALSDRAAVIVTHKGVIRALLALATGWDMMGKPPLRLLPAHAHLFRLNGTLRLVQPNIPLEPEAAS